MANSGWCILCGRNSEYGEPCTCGLTDDEKLQKYISEAVYAGDGSFFQQIVDTLEDIRNSH